MKSINFCLGLLTVGVCGVDVQRVTTSSAHQNSDTNAKPTEVLHVHATRITPLDNDGIVSSFNNYGGWDNPEDLKAMPQCIAEQDQTIWLDTMTKCTGKRCTRHFGLICSHHQWLTERSCLSTGFSPDVVQGYAPYCSRSVLSKAQLYQWIRSITGRTWLVNVGDANDVQTLSPASLEKGYAKVSIVYKAPSCLTRSVSAVSSETFDHVVGSCSFEHATQHTGNQNRPWEYNEGQRSMTALDFETVGYNLTGHNILYGNYIDKKCFCDFFHVDWENDSCSEIRRLDWTKQRLWINATCGVAALPDNWTSGLKTTDFAYIPTQDWQWPACVADMPKQVTDLTDKCAAHACQRDSHGYCKVIPAIERECVCRNIGYHSCGGSCHFFETRINYVNWLYDLCGQVPDWHGLPDGKDELAAPMKADLIPWQWTVKQFRSSKTHIRTEVDERCPSNEWKIGSILLINIATVVFFGMISRSSRLHRPIWSIPPYMQATRFLILGVLIASLQVFANWINAILVQQNTGFQNTPVFQLMLLWCSVPRPTSLVLFRLALRPFTTRSLSIAASSLVAEAILQAISIYFMARTVRYGFQHDFYSGGLDNVEGGQAANLMYIGALLWIIMVVLILLALAHLNDGWESLELWLSSLWNQCSLAERETKYKDSDRTPLMGSERPVYGTLTNTTAQKTHTVSRETLTIFLLVAAGATALLCFTQWLFWGGFIGLSSDE